MASTGLITEDSKNQQKTEIASAIIGLTEKNQETQSEITKYTCKFTIITAVKQERYMMLYEIIINSEFVMI